MSFRIADFHGTMTIFIENISLDAIDVNELKGTFPSEGGLWIRGVPDDVISLDFLKELKGLRKLSLQENHGATNIDMAAIAACPTLKELYVQEGSFISQFTHRPDRTGDIERIDLSPFRQHPSIESIILRARLLSKVNLDGLNDAPNLRLLEIIGNNFEQIDLEPLDGSTSLETLYVTSANDFVHYDTRSYVPQRRSMRSRKFIPILPRCPNLRIFNLNGFDVETVSLENAPYCINLQEVMIQYSVKHIDLRPLAHCQSLKILNLLRNPLVELDITPLMELPDLVDASADRSVKFLVAREYEHLIDYEMDMFLNREVEFY